MKLSAFVVSAAIIVAFCAATPAHAQEVQCLACATSDYTFNSYCQSYNGSWANCQTVCEGYYCSCRRDSGGRCLRGSDG
ncbi:MAG TPA: hypothetical protein VF911_07770, partial [Thermoanaerobaculia bacterium]